MKGMLENFDNSKMNILGRPHSKSQSVRFLKELRNLHDGLERGLSEFEAILIFDIPRKI
jgi:hypothetical protein